MVIHNLFLHLNTFKGMIMTTTSNIFTKPELMHLIVDANHSDAVLLATGSTAAAKAVAMCNRNLRLKTIETWAPWIDSGFKICNFNDPSIAYIFKWNSNTQTRSAEPAPAELLTPEFKQYRQEIKLRLDWLEVLGTVSDVIMSPVTETPLHIEYADSILDQLRRCDPENNSYTDAIAAYATATDCTPAAAYAELNLHMENMAHARLRNLGIYIKYRNLLNAAPATADAQRAVWHAARAELINNSLV
jgi:hypothetical protein